jgi:hypothetical protein
MSAFDSLFGYIFVLAFKLRRRQQHFSARGLSAGSAREPLKITKKSLCESPRWLGAGDG